MVRDAAFLVVIAAVGLAFAGGVLAADRALDASLPKVVVTATGAGISPADLSVRAGEWTLVEFVNDDTTVREWMVDGVPNLDIVARPGQTAKLRLAARRARELQDHERHGRRGGDGRDADGRGALRCVGSGGA